MTFVGAGGPATREEIFAFVAENNGRVAARAAGRVSAEDAPALDRAALLTAFVERGAQFVIVSGVASQVYGATRVAKDLDRRPAWSADNLERVAAALRDLRRVRMKIGERSMELLDVAVDVKTLAKIAIVPWRTTPGRAGLAGG